MAKKRNYEDELESQLAAIVGGDAKNRMTEVLSRQGPNPDELFKKNTVGRQKTVDETGHDQTIKQEPDQMVSPNGVTRSDHGVTRSDHGVTRSDHGVTRSDHGVTRSDQMVSPDIQTWCDHLVSPHHLKLTKNEQIIVQFIKRMKELIVPTKVLSTQLNIPVTTLYKALKRLHKKGIIIAEKNGNDGTYLKFLSDDVVTPNGQTTPHHMVTPNGATMSHQMVSPNGQTTPPSKIDRYKESIYLEEENKNKEKARLLTLTAEDVAFYWPYLHRLDFGPEQIAQIVARLEKIGKPLDKVLQSLDYVEWELSQSTPLMDATGKEVADPLAYIFQALARTGYYRRPKGYVSPVEQAERDAAEEAKCIAQARKVREEAEFETWETGLSQEERAELLVGKLGPDRQWLKQQWRKLREAKAPG